MQRTRRGKDTEYILIIPICPIHESFILKAEKIKDNRCRLTTLAIAKGSEDWETVVLEPEEYDSLEGVLSAVQPMYDVIYLTKKEAFLEIL